MQIFTESIQNCAWRSISSISFVLLQVFIFYFLRCILKLHQVLCNCCRITQFSELNLWLRQELHFNVVFHYFNSSFIYIAGGSHSSAWQQMQGSPCIFAAIMYIFFIEDLKFKHNILGNKRFKLKGKMYSGLYQENYFKSVS